MKIALALGTENPSERIWVAVIRTGSYGTFPLPNSIVHRNRPPYLTSDFGE